MSRGHRGAGLLAAMLATIVLGVGPLVLSACTTDPSPRAGSPAMRGGGDPSAGADTIAAVGCGSCHRIPGIPNAEALVGPPLDSWSRRSFIAGTLPNSQQNLTEWIADPQSVRPGSAMPRLELTDQEVLDVVAYLFSLD